MLICRQTGMKIVVTTDNYFAQGQQGELYFLAQVRRYKFQHRSRPVRIEASHAFNAPRVSRCTRRNPAASARLRKIVDQREVYVDDGTDRVDYLFVIGAVIPRAETGLRDARDARNPKLAESFRESQRTASPPTCPPRPARAFHHRSSARRRPRDRTVFFEHRAKQVFDVARVGTWRRPRGGGGG